MLFVAVRRNNEHCTATGGSSEGALRRAHLHLPRLLQGVADVGGRPAASGLFAYRLQHDSDPHRLAPGGLRQVILKPGILWFLRSRSLFDHDGLAGLRGRSQIPRSGSATCASPPLGFCHHLGTELRGCRISLDQGHLAALDSLCKQEIVRQLLVRQIWIWQEGAQQRQVLIFAGGQRDRLLDRVKSAPTLGNAVVHAPL